MELKEQKQLRHIIREMVDEFVSDFYNQEYESKKAEKKHKKHHHKEESNDRDGAPGKESDEKLGAMSNRRRTVIRILKNKYIDCAPYAYDLWPDKAADDKKNCRSQFYKCRDGKLNDNGDPYSFTDSEIMHLYSKLTAFDTKKKKGS